MTKASLARKAATVFTAVGMSFTLIACGDNGEETNDNGTNSVSEENGNGNSDSGETSESGTADTQEIATVVTDYYTESFTRPTPGGTDAVMQAQEEMIEAAGTEEIFNTADPNEAMENLDQSNQDALLEASEKYGDSSNFVNYEELGIGDKVLMNVITMMFKSMVAGQLSELDMTISVDESAVTVDGDTAIVPSSGVLVDSGQGPQGGIVTIETPLIQTDDGWKIDGQKFVAAMMTPAPQPQPAPMPAQ